MNLQTLNSNTQDSPAMCEAEAMQQKYEQFISTLMHDLRNPVGAISNGALLLKRLPLDERSAAIVDVLHECTQKIVQILEDARNQADSY